MTERGGTRFAESIWLSVFREWPAPRLDGRSKLMLDSLPKGIDYVPDNNPNKIGSELGHWYGKDGCESPFFFLLAIHD